MGEKRGGFRWVLLGLALVVLAVSVVYALRPRVAPMPEVFAEGVSLTEALERARESERVVVAVATADWCAPCQAYKRGALTDGAVEEWLDAHSVAVMVDVTNGAPADAEMLRIGAIPATFVVSGDGEVVGSQVGNTGSDELLRFLSSRLEATTGGG